MISRILIKHLAGSKAHQIEQFDLDGTHELLVGRGPDAKVAFDGQLEDTVSRRHALIKVIRGDRLSLSIADLGSRNGVRVNGEPVQDEQTLVPGDVVELSPEGPMFRVSLEPDCLYVADEASPRRMLSSPADKPTEPFGESTARLRYQRIALWTSLVLAGAGAGVVMDQLVQFRASPQKSSRLQPPAAENVDGQAANARTTGARSVAAVPVARVPPAPAGATEIIVQAPSAAVVAVEARWRLYDTLTGKPVFQKAITQNGEHMPCFVLLDDERIVPWLTTEDEERTNNPVGGVVRGSGFIISGDGSIITSAHNATGWKSPYRGINAEGFGAIFHVGDGPARQPHPRLIDLRAPQVAPGMADWVPGEGGLLFRSRYAVPFGSSENAFEGRNDMLTVRLPFSHLSVPVQLVRASAQGDVAELKIEVAQQLPAMELAQDSTAQIGATVTILGYSGLGNRPDSTGGDAMANDTAVAPSPAGSVAPLPALSSVQATIIGVNEPFPPDRNAGIAVSNGPAGGVYQLSAAAPQPEDGSPVLDVNRRVLGVLASATIGNTTHLYAYPSKFIRALLLAR
jgi:serine protease Do